MKNIEIWVIKVTVPERNDGKMQVRHTKKYERALLLMEKAHSAFLEYLKTRKDVDQSRIKNDPDGCCGLPVNAWKVYYPIICTNNEFMWRKAYFSVDLINFDLLQNGDRPEFDLFD